MKSYAKRIDARMDLMYENILFEANTLHHIEFPEIPEASFYKSLERLCKSERLVHVAKGLYYKPKKTRFGIMPISDDEIVSHYVSNGRGVIVGYHMYNQKGITTQVGKHIDVLSKAITGKKKTAGNVKVQQADLPFTPKTIPVIETLEILQNYNKIEDVNKKGLSSYMIDFADRYSDSAANEILQKRKYKKSTIAFMKRLLDYQKVPNSLEQHLCSLSHYAIPDAEEIYEY